MSPDLCIARYKNGITLVKPELCKLPALSKVLVSDINKFTIDIYFYNNDSTFKTVNEATAMSCGFDSPDQASGSSLYETAIHEYADRLIKNNQLVLKYKTRSFLYEEIKCRDGSHYRGVSLKMPWYDNDAIVGIFGCTIVENKHNLVDSLNHLLDLGLMGKNHSLLNIFQSRNIDEVPLTQRESDILYLIVQGRTAKQAGDLLGLSYRTIENYIARLKCKVGVDSKSELISFYMGKF